MKNSMLARLFLHLPGSPFVGVTQVFRRRLRRLATVVILAIGVASRAEAGPAEVKPPRTSVRTEQAPVAPPEPKISTLPYLLAVGPMDLVVKPAAGPRVRQPPLLPPPKVEEPIEDKEKSKADADTKAMPTPSAPPEPSAFSPDTPPTLLPKDRDPGASATEKRETPRDSVLDPSFRSEPELKDAVIYFDTPVGPHGAQLSVPAIVPFSSPSAVTVPESRAVYRKEKE